MTSGNDPLAFTKLMPGFDFMRQFAQAATGKSAMPNLTEWVAPTASIQEIDKRIVNLKAVQGWLEQNVQVLRATVQALEIQKMTLGVLQGMNLNQADIAKAFAASGQAAGPAPSEAVTQTESISQVAAATETAQPAPRAAQPAQRAAKAAPASAQADPLQWWEALTRQFQTIAANALREAGQTMPPLAPAGSTEPAPAAPPPRKSAAKRAAKPGVKRTASQKQAPPPASASRRSAA
ncbi:MAG: hypothetical protein LBU72_03035 [Burkholderiaceae bacterium]|jgi:hypothetical protein|nr:hypothetical protein [Burkholderiaceae bacterium]